MSASQWIETTCPCAGREPDCIRGVEPSRSWQGLSLPLPLPEAQVAALCMIASCMSDKCSGVFPAIIAIFTGRDAAGKLMAAEALAYETQRVLYRADASELSELPTRDAEEHFTRTLNEAHAGDAILMLDNAESLPNSLLHALADYPGPRILTADSAQELSKSLRRVSHYLIDFPFPTDNE